MNPKEFYSRKDIQEELLRIVKDREVQVWYGEIRGKRPDSIQFSGDILDAVKKGATSFHISEERWRDPLLLRTGMTKNELNDLTKGWDLIIDVDGRDLEYSKIAADLIVNALRFYGVKSISVKFSGNKGFHIGIPFESFPDKVRDQETRTMFPELLRIVAEYLKEMIREPLKKKLKREDVFSLVDIDTMLISSRHLFRSIYSFHEKSGLVSIPINPDEVLSFDIGKAKAENVKTDFKFLEYKGDKITRLITQAFDNVKRREEIKEERKYEISVVRSDENLFPPCIKELLRGVKEDGRKRGLFVLINFLRSVGWNFSEVRKKVEEWDGKNYEPLKKNYIEGQISWHEKQNKNILPPNCTNASYYQSLGLCNPDNFCKMVKNPVNYSLKKRKILKQVKKG
jgi:hypothetical protein